MTPPLLDPDFAALPYESLGDAALLRASELEATYADFRFERHKLQHIAARDRELENVTNADIVGYGIRVVHGGAWGFASGVDQSADAVTATATRAVEVARALAELNSEPVELAAEPAHVATWISEYEIDPLQVPDEEKIGFLLEMNERLLASGKVQHASGRLSQVMENKYFSSLTGARITQQRVRLESEVEATRIAPDGEFDTMRTVAPPAGRGWEHCARVYDYATDVEAIPDLLEEKMRARSVEPGRYDLIIDPTNLWLTIHESIGHSTELDRVLGYEANYAGTSFATLDKLHSLQFGSPVMRVTGDRVAEHGLSTVGYDDEGVEAQEWDIVRDGVLVGYQLNRQMARKLGFGRSNGCAFADSPAQVPLQRMPNVSLRPAARDFTLQELIGGVERGIYIVGDRSWSIDMQRYNFQFTGQRFFEIRGGRLAGQLRDVAYQATTTEFWNALEAVGGPSTYVLSGAFNCGKGQPGQVAPVSHGCPAALFRGINVLNTSGEAGR
ncbi:MAG: TldD/PmbA family protein [Actinomycetota bacterium]